MKKIFSFTLMIICTANVCYAILGDTLTKSATRYGNKIAGPVEIGAIEQYVFQDRNYFVRIDFYKNQAVKLQFQRVNKERFSVYDLERILKLNGRFLFDTNNPELGVVKFISNDGSKAATYYLKNNVLAISSLSNQ